MPEDLKKLETLSYVPNEATVPCPGPDCQHCEPANQVGTDADGVNEPIDTSNYTDPRAANGEITSNIEPIKTGCAVKSPNLEIIKQVEGCMSVAMKLLEQIE